MKVANDLQAKDAVGSEKIAKVSIVGVGMRSHAGVASRMFESLANENINIQMISTSAIRVSCVVSKADIEKATNILHQAFELHKG